LSFKKVLIFFKRREILLFKSKDPTQSSIKPFTPNLVARAREAKTNEQSGEIGAYIPPNKVCFIAHIINPTINLQKYLLF